MFRGNGQQCQKMIRSASCVNGVWQDNIDAPYQFSETGLIEEVNSSYLHLKNGKKIDAILKILLQDAVVLIVSYHGIYLSWSVLYIKGAVHTAKK